MLAQSGWVERSTVMPERRRQGDVQHESHSTLRLINQEGNQ